MEKTILFFYFINGAICGIVLCMAINKIKGGHAKIVNSIIFSICRFFYWSILLFSLLYVLYSVENDRSLGAAIKIESKKCIENETKADTTKNSE